MMSGTLVSAAHTLAHNQAEAGDTALSVNNGHDEHHGALNGGETSDHHEDSHDTGEHGAELHFTVIDVAVISNTLAVLPHSLNATYVQQQSPTPKLPPDPYPDRA